MSEQVVPITANDFERAEGVGDWRVLGDGAHVSYRTATFTESLRLVAAIGSLPGIDAHPPDLDVRADGVTVRLLSRSNDYYGMSEADVEIARGVAGAARVLGLRPDPSALQSMIVIPGAPDGIEIQPFWRAVLGYEPRADSPDEDLVDPHDRHPGVWLEAMDEPRGDGGGAIHVAVWVPRELAESRVAAALAAGGRLVRDEFAPSWWTLADAAGNEADIATVANRD
jgi:4a-hydroxytetrahydrobiopterin dehydratase